MSLTKKNVLIKATMGLLLLIYACIYIYIYKNWLNYNFDYFGFVLNPLHFLDVLVILIGVCLPALLIPTNFNRVSVFIYWVLYLAIYVPSLITPVFIQLQPLNEVYKLVSALIAGNCFIAFSFYLPLVSISYRRFSPGLFWSFTHITAISLLLYVIYIYKGKFNLVSFADVYDVRFEGGEVAEGNFSGYAIMILSGCLFPLYISSGLVLRTKIHYVIGCLGQILLYATAAMKGIILTIPIITGLYFLSKGRPHLILIKVLIVLISLCCLCLYFSGPQGTVTYLIASIVFMRTLGIPGLLTTQYHDFFTKHPYTYLSHVNGINQFVPYPYDKPLGLVLGEHYFGSDMVNSNANFWVTDGVAGFGIMGIIYISIFVAAIFYIIDTVSAGINLRLLILSTIVVSMNLGNTSIFTTLLSGGLGLLCLIFTIMPKEKEI